MVVFDNWKFREILKSIVEKKELNGDRISSKQQLYVRIGEELHVSPDTVKYWQRDKSSGPDPRMPELLDELECYLGYPSGTLRKKINIEEEKTEDKRMDKVSEFQKQQIMDIYEALKKFVSGMDIENEDEYYRIRAVIERNWFFRIQYLIRYCSLWTMLLRNMCLKRNIQLLPKKKQNMRMV